MSCCEAVANRLHTNLLCRHGVRASVVSYLFFSRCGGHRAGSCFDVVTPLTVGEGEGLQLLAETHFEVSIGDVFPGGELVHVRWPADWYDGGPPVSGHVQGAGAADDEVDVLGVVVQFDAGLIAAGGGALVVQCPGPAVGEAVVGQRRRVVENGGALVVCSGAAVVDDLADRQIGLGCETGMRCGLGVLAGCGQFRAGVGVVEEFSDQGFGAGVVAFAEFDVPNRASGVDQVFGGPISVAVVRPGGQVVVERDRVGDVQVGAAGDVAGDFFEGVLGAVHADGLKPRALVSVVPVDDMGDGALAVDAGVGPEVDQDHFAAQRLEVDRGVPGGVEPTGDAGETAAVPQFSSCAAPFEQFARSLF